MRIEAHNKFGSPINAEVTKVVVYDDYDNPIAVAVKHGRGWVYVGHVRDPEFADCLSALGVDKACVVDVLNPKDLTTLPERGKL